MLAEIRIDNLGVISEASAQFHDGFTVLTGETGAGKTMVVTSLHLLSGSRADPARVRVGAERAVVEGRFAVDTDETAGALPSHVEREIARLLEAAGAERLDEEGVERGGARARVDLGLDGRQAELRQRHPLLPAQDERLGHRRHVTVRRMRVPFKLAQGAE